MRRHLLLRRRGGRGRSILAAPPAPPGGGGGLTTHPTFRAGTDTTLLPDGATTQSFDGFANIDAVHGAGYYLNGRATPGAYSLVPGRGGSGLALRQDYLNAHGELYAPSLEMYLTGIANAATTQVQDLVLSFWMRTSVGADPSFGGTNPDGFKFIIPFRNSGGVRITNGVGSGALTGTRNPYTRPSLGGVTLVARDNDFSADDHAWLQKQPGSPRWGNLAGDAAPAAVVLNDGNWHQVTARYINGNGAGRVLNWIDEGLVLDTADVDSPTYPTSAVGFQRVIMGDTHVVMPVPLAYEWYWLIDDLQAWEVAG